MTKQPKPKTKQITARQIKDALRKNVTSGGTPEEQKRKAEWFKNHVIVEFYTGKDDEK